jgi:hypothetical protein
MFYAFPKPVKPSRKRRAQEFLLFSRFSETAVKSTLDGRIAPRAARTYTDICGAKERAQTSCERAPSRMAIGTDAYAVRAQAKETPHSIACDTQVQYMYSTCSRNTRRGGHNIIKLRYKQTRSRERKRASSEEDGGRRTEDGERTSLWTPSSNLNLDSGTSRGSRSTGYLLYISLIDMLENSRLQ